MVKKKKRLEKQIVHFKEQNIVNMWDHIKWPKTCVFEILEGWEMLEEIKSAGTGVVAQKADPIPAVPANHMGTVLVLGASCLIQLPAYSLGRPQRMAQVLTSLHSHGRPRGSS